MELSLPDMPFGVCGRCAREVTHPGQPCRHRRRRKLAVGHASPDLPPAAVAGAAPAQWHPRKPDQAVLLTGAEIDQVGTLLRGLADKRLVEL
jgi:hypothetical protein